MLPVASRQVRLWLRPQTELRKEEKVWIRKVFSFKWITGAHLLLTWSPSLLQQLLTPAGSSNGSITRFCSEAHSSPHIRTQNLCFGPDSRCGVQINNQQIASDAVSPKIGDRLLFCREVTKQTTLNDKGRCQSLPSLNAPKNKPNFTCCNWSNSAYPDLHCWLHEDRREQEDYRGRRWRQPWLWKSRLFKFIVCGNAADICWEHSALHVTSLR